jgi:hypothetical protein
LWAHSDNFILCAGIGFYLWGGWPRGREQRREQRRKVRRKGRRKRGGKRRREEVQEAGSRSVENGLELILIKAPFILLIIPEIGFSLGHVAVIIIIIIASDGAAALEDKMAQGGLGNFTILPKLIHINIIHVIHHKVAATIHAAPGSTHVATPTTAKHVVRGITTSFVIFALVDAHGEVGWVKEVTFPLHTLDSMKYK